MVDLSISHAPRARFGMLAHVVEFFVLLGASIRVSRAVEAHRAPSAEDLAILGITGKLPYSR